jgi:cyanophycin synthetase
MTKKYIDIINVMFLRGPNIWTYRPTLEAWVDIGDLEDFPSNTIPGFYERLTALLPTLVEHHCGIGERGGFLQRLRDGTWPAHIMEHVMIELQNLAGMQSAFGKARSTSKRGVYKVVVRSRNENVSRAALVAARDLVMAAIEDKPFDVGATVERLRAMVDSQCIGPSTGCIVDAATERGIPAIRLNDGNLVQLGYGSRQRRIWTAETDRTRAISESISSDKDLSKSLLRACGVPVPEGRIVGSPEDAWEAAEEIGVPVVVKPTDANHGRGVSIDLTTRETVEAAYHLAIEEGSDVIVERFIPGNEHRILVVGGRMVAAAGGKAVWVTGDGTSSITALIESQVNSDPRRGDTEDFPLNPVRFDEDPTVELELRRQGFDPDSVPEAGKEVLIQRKGNVAFDVTDQVHPQVAAAAALAARVVGLDIAGVDLVVEDIAKPLEPQGGAIVEINAGPGLLMHLKPADGQPRPVGEAIAKHLFGENDQDHGRIPVVGVSGSYGKTTVARMIARMIYLAGSYVGLACSDGLYLNQRQIDRKDCANWKSGQRVLMNKAVEAAVIENCARGILSDGLAYDRCKVGVVLNMAESDILPEFYIENMEQVATVLRTQVDVVLPDGAAVLNAEDARVAALAELCDGEVVLFSLDPALAAVDAHRAGGGRAVVRKDDKVVLAAGREETAIAELSELPLAPAGDAARRAFQIQNILAAVGAAWALGMPADLIRAGIVTAREDLAQAAASQPAHD